MNIGICEWGKCATEARGYSQDKDGVTVALCPTHLRQSNAIWSTTQLRYIAQKDLTRQECQDAGLTEFPI